MSHYWNKYVVWVCTCIWHIVLRRHELWVNRTYYNEHPVGGIAMRTRNVFPRTSSSLLNTSFSLYIVNKKFNLFLCLPFPPSVCLASPTDCQCKFVPIEFTVYIIFLNLNQPSRSWGCLPIYINVLCTSENSFVANSSRIYRTHTSLTSPLFVSWQNWVLDFNWLYSVTVFSYKLLWCW